MAEARKAFVERLFAHRGALQAFFYRRLRTKSDAADLVQDLYLRMLRVTDIDAIRNPEAYLFTVAANLLKENAAADRRQAESAAIEEADVPQLLLSNVPKWSMSATADYAWALTNVWRAHLGSGFRWIGREWSGLGAVEDHSSYPAGLLSPYSVLDLNASIAKGPLTLRAFARNVTDQRAYLQSSTVIDFVANPPALLQMNSTLLQPRTVGVGFDYSF